MRVGAGFLFSWTPGDMAELKCPEGSGALRGVPPSPTTAWFTVSLAWPCPWRGVGH